MKYILKILLLLLAVNIYAAPLAVLKDRHGRNVPYAGRLSAAPVYIPQYYRQPSREMRGVWMTTVDNKDIGKHKNAESFKREFISKLDRLAAYNINTLVFQVRPSGDAFYPSKINPWSRHLTGVEGQGIPGFDPLKFMIGECRRRNIEFHAWLNPYRVIGKTHMSKSAYLRTLPYSNFARRNPNMVLAAPLKNGGIQLFLNPGEPAVRQHIVNTVAEIVRNYPVDAIHFDDYFYPYAQVGNADIQTYRRYGRGQKLAQWRRDNVTTVLRQLRNTIRIYSIKQRRHIQFGLSPFGIWANKKSLASGSLTLGNESYFSEYADTRKWMRENIFDYIVPQIYWEFGHSAASYSAVADWWAAQAKASRTRLYIGIGLYRLGTGNVQNPMELVNQLKYNTKHPEIKGQMLFGAGNMLSPSNSIMKQNLRNLRRNCWTRKVPVR